jgi:hypothetical protein
MMRYFWAVLLLATFCYAQEITLPETVLKQYVGVYQLAPKFNLMISLENGQLMSQASGQGKAPIFASSEAKFFLKVVDAQIDFVKDDKGKVTSLMLHQGGRDTPAQRISDTLPPPKKEIIVSPKILAQYAGTYELRPGFDLVVTLEGDHLITQATGQSQLPIFAESETKFFPKVMEASIEFFKDEKGAVTHLMLNQGPAEIKAPRK